MSDNALNPIVADSVDMLRSAGYGDDAIAQFTDSAVSVLNDYAELVGVGTRVEYYIAKKLGRIELRMSIPGAQYDPLKNGKGAKKRRLASVVRMNLNTESARILGFLLGTALLLLGDSVSELREVLTQVNEWVMSAMRLVLTVIPAIPFLSLFTLIAKGNIGEILGGWKFIVASYIAFGVCTVAKAVKASARTGIAVSDFWRRIKPVVMMAFSTGSTSAPLKKVYEVSEKEFKIKPEITSFWIPMCSAMLSPKTTVNVVIAAFMVAEMTGMAITTSFLVVLVLVTLELSIASPETTSAWTIMFETLSMPTGYVGLFTVYRMLTNNFNAGCTEAYSLYEEVEAAYKLGGVDGRDVQGESA